MRGPTLVLPLMAILLGPACSSEPPNAVEIEQNGAVQAETTTSDAGDRARMLAQQAENLNRQAEAASGARRDELRNQANAAMEAALAVQRSGGADAAQIDAAAERNAEGAKPPQ